MMSPHHPDVFPASNASLKTYVTPKANIPQEKMQLPILDFTVSPFAFKLNSKVKPFVSEQNT